MATAFISYKSEEEAYAAGFRHLLDPTPHLSWYDDKLPIGKNWKKEVTQKIKESTHFIFMMTPASVASPHCLWELRQAKRRKCTIVIVPILFEGDKDTPPNSIKNLTFVDVRAGWTPENETKLLAALGNMPPRFCVWTWTVVDLLLLLVLGAILTLFLRSSLAAPLSPPTWTPIPQPDVKVAYEFIVDTSAAMLQPSADGRLRYEIAQDAIMQYLGAPGQESVRRWTGVRLSGGGTEMDCTRSTLAVSGTALPPADVSTHLPPMTLAAQMLGGNPAAITSLAESFRDLGTPQALARGLAEHESLVRVVFIFLGSSSLQPCQGTLVENLNITLSRYQEEGITAAACTFILENSEESRRLAETIRSLDLNPELKCVFNGENAPEIVNHIASFIDTQVIPNAEETVEATLAVRATERVVLLEQQTADAVAVVRTTTPDSAPESTGRADTTDAASAAEPAETRQPIPATAQIAAIASNTPELIPTLTTMPQPTLTPPQASNTSPPPATPVPPSATPQPPTLTPSPTNTSVPPTPTRLPPTPTRPAPSNTPAPTDTPLPPTVAPVPPTNLPPPPTNTDVPTPTPPPTANPTAGMTFDETYDPPRSGFITTDAGERARVRDGPGLGYNEIGALDYGSYVVIFGQTNGWYYIGSGWIYAGLIDAAANTATLEVLQTAILTITPATSTPVPPTAPPGTTPPPTSGDNDPPLTLRVDSVGPVGSGAGGGCIAFITLVVNGPNPVTGTIWVSNQFVDDMYEPGNETFSPGSNSRPVEFGGIGMDHGVRIETNVGTAYGGGRCG